MELNTIILIGAVASSWFALTVALVCLAKSSRQHREVSQMINKLAKELRAGQSGSVGMGRRVLALESRLRKTSERQEEISESQQLTAFPTQYRQAAKMFENGDSVNDVATNCGLSRTEASLLSLMNRQKGAA